MTVCDGRHEGFIPLVFAVFFLCFFVILRLVALVCSDLKNAARAKHHEEKLERYKRAP